jgi:hypothetical protein
VVPIVLYHDVESALIITSDAGTSSVTLKDLLLSNTAASDLPTSVAATFGTELGSFLGQLHSNGNSSAASDARNLFAQYDWARTLTATVFHGQVNAVLSGNRYDVPIPIGPDVQKDIDDAVEEMAQLVQSSQETIVMGDFWSGNVLVQMASQQDRSFKLTVIDWELAKLGFSANDVGQFAAEIVLASEFHPQCSEAARVLMNSFCGAYRQGYANFDPECAAKAAMHIGSHLISIASYAPPWGTKPGFPRAMGELGVQYLQHGYKRNWNWIKSKTLLAGLCPE